MNKIKLFLAVLYLMVFCGTAFALPTSEQTAASFALQLTTLASERMQLHDDKRISIDSSDDLVLLESTHPTPAQDYSLLITLESATDKELLADVMAKSKGQLIIDRSTLPSYDHVSIETKPSSEENSKTRTTLLHFTTDNQPYTLRILTEGKELPVIVLSDSPDIASKTWTDASVIKLGEFIQSSREKRSAIVLAPRSNGTYSGDSNNFFTAPEGYATYIFVGLMDVLGGAFWTLGSMQWSDHNSVTGLMIFCKVLGGLMSLGVFYVVELVVQIVSLIANGHLILRLIPMPC